MVRDGATYTILAGFMQDLGWNFFRPPRLPTFAPCCYN